MKSIFRMHNCGMCFKVPFGMLDSSHSLIMSRRNWQLLRPTHSLVTLFPKCFIPLHYQTLFRHVQSDTPYSLVWCNKWTEQLRKTVRKTQNLHDFIIRRPWNRSSSFNMACFWLNSFHGLQTIKNKFLTMKNINLIVWDAGIERTNTVINLVLKDWISKSTFHTKMFFWAIF